MQAHNDHKEGRLKESLTKYAFMAELGYEVAQSNAAFILDRGIVLFFILSVQCGEIIRILSGPYLFLAFIRMTRYTRRSGFVQ